MSVAYKGFKVDNVAKEKADWYCFTEYCKGCGLCIVKCPKKCLQWSKEVGIYQTPAVKPVAADCIGCGTCAMICPDNAIKIVKK